MRRIVLAVLGTASSLALLLAYPTSHNASASGGGAVAVSEPVVPSSGSSSSAAASAKASSGSSSGSGSTSGTYTGDAVQTRWGVVQVRITVQNGKITKAEAVQYPNDNGHDQEINSYALPVLAQEAVAAQNASIDAVSGATVTSGGYIQSLQSAVDAAHL